MSIRTYHNLDTTPRIFFVPGEQAFPWALIGLGSWLGLGQGFKLSPACWVTVALWLMATWWVLTFKGAHHFFGRLVSVPFWTRALLPIESGERIFDKGGEEV